MQRLVDAWRQQTAYQEILLSLTTQQLSALSGLPHMAQAAMTAALFADTNHPLLLLTAEESEAVAMADDLRTLLGDQVMYFPVIELLPLAVYAHNIELIAARIDVLSRLAQGEKILVVACANAIVRRLIPAPAFLDQHLRLSTGSVYEPAVLASRLADMGYERTPLTEIPGSFSLRGSIVDIFPITNDRPYRVEFFDDEIESIRYFDPADQLSAEAVKEMLIPPANELPLDDDARRRAAASLEQEIAEVSAKLHGEDKKNLTETYTALLEHLHEGVWDSAMETLISNFYPDAGSIFDYLSAGTVILSEPQTIKQKVLDLTSGRDARYCDLLDRGRLLPSFYHNFLVYEELSEGFSQHRLLLLSQLDNQNADFKVKLKRSIKARELPNYAHNPQGFIRDMREFAERDYLIFIAVSSDTRYQRAQEIIREAELSGINVIQKSFSCGFESQQLHMALVTEKELFAKETRKKQRRAYQNGEKITNFLDLRVGDYVVHIYQGIGQYMGVQRLRVDDVERDYLLIQYRDEDRLYLPVDQLDLIQKYVGNDGNPPKLNRLGGSEWERAKEKVRVAVQKMAEDLLQLYAEREKVKGHAFSPDVPWQREFEDAFPYEETNDQLTSLAEIKKDMESERVMDRLLCGDVGYGKTEIALRAAFKAIMDGKQVAILVPTTVLAQQHYHTITERFSGFPVSYGCLSRFYSPKEQKETLAKLASGELDLVVGTHRLLSADVQFKDLGLLIIDEEQRFGVAHKEKIKALKTQIDVLTLSATPIPRTLHMALVGMRDMSIITTPPADRLPVQTYVVEYHEQLIRDVIAREVGRGGQVFFLHNRVLDIYNVAEKLQSILPGVRIDVAHGQMKERELEQAMMDFVAGKADVLLCTTIIESGLDIPNVNTLIVDEADTFGLSQLYQLRGRVGRSERQAFAYFTFRHNRTLNDLARKRLTAIRDFTELGAGFKIAMRDLELRGAGNILGPEQHGHIVAVGFDLYCKLLEEEMLKASGKETRPHDIATLLELGINAYLPDNYITDSILKVEVYRRMAAAECDKDIDDLAAELRDRYGELPLAVVNLCKLSKVKVFGKKLQIASIIQKSNYIEIKFADGHPITGNSVLELLDAWPNKIYFGNKKLFAINLRTAGMSKTDSSRTDLLLKLLGNLDDIVHNK